MVSGRSFLSVLLFCFDIEIHWHKLIWRDIVLFNFRYCYLQLQTKLKSVQYILSENNMNLCRLCCYSWANQYECNNKVVKFENTNWISHIYRCALSSSEVQRWDEKHPLVWKTWISQSIHLFQEHEWPPLGWLRLAAICSVIFLMLSDSSLKSHKYLLATIAIRAVARKEPRATINKHQSCWTGVAHVLHRYFTQICSCIFISHTHSILRVPEATTNWNENRKLETKRPRTQYTEH